MMKSRSAENFQGCDKEYDIAEIVVFGAPFDSTTTYRPGTRFASKIMRSESYGLETYSPYQEKDISDQMIFDAGDMDLPFGNPGKVLELVESFVRMIYINNKTPVMVGGEHLLTLAAVKAALEKYPELYVLQFDAHADLRQAYIGEKLSHSTVMKRIWEHVGDFRIYQFGIRSGEKEEFDWADSHLFINKFNLDGLSEVIEELKDKPVYFTIDLDILDPSVFPGTGTPEPGGISYTLLQNAVIEVGRKLNIIGADLTELSPPYDQSGTSTAVACKILRELLLAIS